LCLHTHLAHARNYNEEHRTGALPRHATKHGEWRFAHFCDILPKGAKRQKGLYSAECAL
jgi:hypothetical protein